MKTYIARVFTTLYFVIYVGILFYRDPLFSPWSQPRKISVDSCKLHSTPSLAVGNRHADYAITSVCCPLLSCPPACGSKQELLCHGTHSCPPLSTSSPDLPASPSGRCSHQEKANWLSGPSNHRPLKECSTNKIYIVCHCWANYFFRKVQKAVWELDAGIWNHTMLLFLWSIHWHFQDNPRLSYYEYNIASFWFKFSFSKFLSAIYRQKRATCVTEDRIFPPCWHDVAYF